MHAAHRPHKTGKIQSINASIPHILPQSVHVKKWQTNLSCLSLYIWKTWFGWKHTTTHCSDSCIVFHSKQHSHVALRSDQHSVCRPCHHSFVTSRDDVLSMTSFHLGLDSVSMCAVLSNKTTDEYVETINKSMLKQLTITNVWLMFSILDQIDWLWVKNESTFEMVLSLCIYCACASPKWVL